MESTNTDGGMNTSVLQANEGSMSSIPNAPIRVQDPKKNIAFIIIIVLLVLAVFAMGYSLFKNSDPKNDDTEMQKTDSNTMAESETNPNVDPETGVYTNETKGFSLVVPKGWNVSEGSAGAYVTMTSYSDAGEERTFGVINVVSEKTQGLSFESYLSVSKDYLKKLLTNYKLVKETPVTVDGLRGVIIEGTFDQGELSIRNNQLAVIKDGEAFIVTGTSLDSSWGQYKDVMLESLMSLEVK